MATRTPSLQARSRVHAYWGVYADAASLPNAAGAPLAAAAFVLEAGDVAYSTADGTLFVCTAPGTPSGGDATWASLGGGGGSSGASYLAGAINEESITAGGTEVVVGGFVFDPTQSPGRSAYFRGFETLVYTSGAAPESRIRLYDRGAPLSPTAGTLVAELVNATVQNNPFTSVTAAFLLDPTTPSLGTIVDALRMYEIRVNFVDADSLLVRWAGLEIR